MNLNQYSVSAAQPGLSVDNLKHLGAAVPPLDTQRRIGRFLDEKTARIDGLIEKMAGGNFGLRAPNNFSNPNDRSLLSLLLEYRTALVTAAVTGQIGELNGD